MNKKKYQSYAELSRMEVEDRDFRVRARQADSPFAIIAPHGGRIERGTSRIADAIAGDEHSFHTLEGLKPDGNNSLHISSHRFDEPRALDIAHSVKTVVTVHGAHGEDLFAYFGGLDLALRALMIDALSNAGFSAMDDPSPTRQGRRADNICNRGRSGAGVQIELTTGLRKHLFDQVSYDVWEPNVRFARFVGIVRGTLGKS
ncbi:MAG: poly-gamma-glutamate hydrolase family protein [Gammaproteobacteria bacterium]